MRARSTLALVGAAVALGLFLWFFERQRPSSDERLAQESKVLPGAAEPIDAIEIERGGTTVRIERTGEEGSPAEWRLTEPLSARADGDKVEALVSSLAELEKQRTLDGVPVADVGLAEPRGHVTVYGSGRATRLSVGAGVPASSDVVVAVGDGTPLVTDGGFWDQADIEAAEWRSRSVVPATAAEIRRLEIDRADGRLVFERRDGDMVLREPLADVADQARADGLVSAVAGLKAIRFLDAAAVLESALDPPALALQLDLADRSEPLTVRLSAPEAGGTEIIGESEGQYFAASTELFEMLDVEAGAWQSRAWTEVEVYEIEAAEIVTGGSRIRLRRDGGEWLRDDAAIPYSLVSDLLYAIVDLEGDRIEARSEHAGEPTLEIALSTSAGPEELRVVPADGGDSRAVRSGRDFELAVSVEAVEDLVAKVDAVRAAEPLPEGQERVDS